MRGVFGLGAVVIAAVLGLVIWMAVTSADHRAERLGDDDYATLTRYVGASERVFAEQFAAAVRCAKKTKSQREPVVCMEFQSGNAAATRADLEGKEALLDSKVRVASGCWQALHVLDDRLIALDGAASDVQHSVPYPIGPEFLDARANAEQTVRRFDVAKQRAFTACRPD